MKQDSKLGLMVTATITIIALSSTYIISQHTSYPTSSIIINEKDMTFALAPTILECNFTPVWTGKNPTTLIKFFGTCSELEMKTILQKAKSKHDFTNDKNYDCYIAEFSTNCEVIRKEGNVKP